MAQSPFQLPAFKHRAAAENFPVAGWFIPGPLRETVHAYYAFARLADDVADSTELTVIQKLSMLDALESALRSTTPATQPHEQVAQTAGQQLQAHSIPLSVASDLLIAFRADARNTPPRTLADLMDYCQHSAAPVGRFLLALHGEQSGHDASDALSSALQILNHVQDARGDAETLKRCYIPADWLAAENIELIDFLDPQNLTGTVPGYDPIRDDYTHGAEDTVHATAKAVDPAHISRCLNRMLDQAEHLLVIATPLAATVKHRGLAAQSAAILCLAERLLALLRRNDPWTYKVSLRPTDWMVAATVGLRVRVFGA